MKLLIDEPPLQVLPSLAVLIGLNEAIVLQQLHYWLQRAKTERCGHKWVFNTYEGWREQFPFWSEITIRRAFTSLENHGLVVSDQPEKRARDMRKWYRIDYATLESLSSGTDQNRSKRSDASDQTDQVDAIKLSTSMRSKRADGCDQIDPIFMHEITSETTAETTHTQRAGVYSKHSLEICERYAQWLHDTGQGIVQPAGFAKACWRTGFDDRKIDQFLADKVAREASAVASAPCSACGLARTEPCSEDPAICPLAPLPEEVTDGMARAAC